jgi:hypothetical protein
MGGFEFGINDQMASAFFGVGERVVDIVLGPDEEIVDLLLVEAVVRAPGPSRLSCA